jgi:hypothetical protein
MSRFRPMKGRSRSLDGLELLGRHRCVSRRNLIAKETKASMKGLP